MNRPEDPTPDEQRRRYEERGGDDELMGTVLVVDGEVAWAGPLAVILTFADGQPAVIPADGEVLGIADGSEYTPPS